MTVERIAISLDPELAKAIRKAAGKQTTSAWLADAAIRKLKSQGLLRVVRDWEAEHGPITDAEQRAAEREMTGRRRR
jgi:hypothetical protein